MSAITPFSNVAGVRVNDRKHVNPVLEGILYSTDRKAQVAILQEQSRRSSAASTPDASRKNSVASVTSYSSEKRRKSLFGMSWTSRSGGTGTSIPRSAIL